MRMPASGIRMSEPMPKPTIISPSWDSLKDRRLANSGILGAQAPMNVPFRRNRPETAIREAG